MFPPSKAWPSVLFIVSLARIASASLPLVDFDRMGQVGLTGAFAGLNFFDNSTPTSFDPSVSSLLSRTPQGALTSIADTNSGGSISSACAMNNVYYIAGSFLSIANISTTYVASYSPSSGAFSPLGSGGPDGPVNALFCDSNNDNLWVGGHFSSPGSSVAVWNTKSNSWSPPVFKGLNGPVRSISPNASDSSLFFIGSFTTSFSGGATANNNNPNVPYSKGASPFSSSLVPIPLQDAEVVAAPSSTDPQYSSIQAILCPAGPDGPGSTWLAASGNAALITVRTFTAMSAYGIRLGNTFLSGYGTTAFSVTSIPDNTVQSLTYVDPSTGQNTTCTSNCPLSTDPSILYQDFIFTAPVTLTGVQVTLSEWKGNAPGLHILQLLSSGAFASAISGQNMQSCYAPNPSNVAMTGTWSPKNANTNIPATLQTVLVTTVPVGTPASQAPTFTWMPYVSASGQYVVNLVIPGCDSFQDCALRTSVQITVFPGDGSQPFVSIVSQQVQNDVTVPVYGGPVVPSSSSFVITVTMSLADQPAGEGQNGLYELVAGNVELVLTSANTTSAASGVAGNGSSSLGTQRGFGLFEWPLNLKASADATGVLSNTSETAADVIGVDLYNALGTANTDSAYVSAAVQHPSGIIFLGGSFTFATGSLSGAANIVAYKQGSLVSLSDGGLNGAVASFALYGDELYIGGSFSDTQTPSTQGKLMGVAMYNVKTNSWSTLGAGVNGVVASIALSDSSIQVAGNFTQAVTLAGSTTSVGGFATWDIATSSWVNSGGFVKGNFTFVGNGTSSNGQEMSQFLAGNIQTMAKYGATGMVMLSNSGSGDPTVAPLEIQLGSSANASSSTSVTQKRYNHYRRRPVTWLSRMKIPALFRRQASTASSALPPLPPTPAPAVLAGVFWSNSSSSHEVAIIGGNFTFSASSSTSSQAIVVYDPVTSSATGLAGEQIQGIVRALDVDTQGHLYVGGEFSLTGTNANGFAIYDLVGQQWLTTIAPPLQPHPGSSVVVRSITATSYKSNAIIVAGSFAEAGTVACQGICLFDTTLKQWNALGSGLQGDISSVSSAGSNQELLVAGGVITLPDGTSANVAQYHFANNSWTAVGDPTVIPGPVTAVEVNNGNSSSIFAAGRTGDGSSSFVIFWDGVSWYNIGSDFQADSNISQLLMVPLQNTHSSNSIVESDRVLMISGALSDSSFGTASVVLFDGQTFIPYLASMSAQGTLGYVSSLFYSIANFSFGQESFLATGIVILISIAIAAGVVFLLALIGILWTLLSRKDDKLSRYENEEEDEDSIQHRPSSLLEHINAATRSTILGGQSPFHNVSAEKVEAARTGEAEPEGDLFGPDASNYLRATTPSDAIIGTMVTEEEGSRPAHARFSFDGSGEGELPMTAGMEIAVLDDKDNAWWYARNPHTGREGVVPASYLY
ncbi:cortical protein marker for cell polarity-domain-containing protein [Boletus edulis BED1]|uniref:Cortical protein marker for cell polarity-domain-containing protein n=1 Tax=Boletus edulis BED1 TaxID=1328754 RepID=A0AAD4BJY2_BOLED|nr:cortical protein marker for cell polarity-domain-containing protein [Boletus edulis BED1]